MTGSIVCGVDGSAHSRAALRVAAELAQRLGRRLIVAYVTRPAQVVPAAPIGLVPGTSVMQTDAELRLGERLLEQIALEEELYDAERRALTGIAAERLADLADEEDAELLVVGSRGRGAFKAAFLGSVSNQLVGLARCPVVVVPPGAS